MNGTITLEQAHDDKTIEAYREGLTRRKMSPRSIELYIDSLKLAERFIAKPLGTATHEDIARYLDSISNRKSYTIMARLRAIKLFFKWLGKPEVSDFPMPQNRTKALVSSDLLTEEEIVKMISVSTNPRDKAFWSILFDSACRKGEIIGLNIEDFVIETEKTGYIVVNGKTGTRQVPLSSSIPALKEWVNSHPLRQDPKAPLFIAMKGNFGHRLSEGAIEILLRKTLKHAGINKRVFCHLFRHSRITQLDKNGLSHTAMKYFAGWSQRSNMPSTYSHLSAGDTKDMVYEADRVAQPRTIKKSTILEPISCCKCHAPNDKTNKFCYLCGQALDDNSRKEFAIEETVKLLIKQNPNIAQMISESIGSLKAV